MQALIRLFLAVMLCAVSANDTYCQAIDCPSLKERALHLYKSVQTPKKDKTTYFSARDAEKDSLNQWRLYAESGKVCRLLSDSTFSDIFDFNIVKDSIAIVVAARSKAAQTEITDVFIYKLFLKTPRVSPDEVIEVKELHYHHFDEKAYIGITDKQDHTYFVDGAGVANITELDNQTLSGKELYPTTGGGHFILRNKTDGQEFFLAKQQGNALQTVATGADNVVFVQPNNSILYRQGPVNRFYPVKAGGQPSADYQVAKHFSKESTFTAVLGTDGKWSIIDATDFTLHKVVLPDANLEIEDVMCIPGSHFTLIKTKNDQRKWFYQNLTAGDTAILIAGLPSGTTVVPFFADCVLFQLPDKTVKILSLREKEATVIEGRDISISDCKIFPVERSKKRKKIGPKKFLLIPDRFLIVAGTTSKERDKALLIQFDVSPSGEVWSLLSTDDISDKKYFLSQKRFFVVKDKPTGFWQVKDLISFNPASPRWVFSKAQQFVVIKPFENIDGEFYVRVIKRLGPDSDEKPDLIHVP